MSDLNSELQGLLADVGATPDNSCVTEPQETEAKLVEKSEHTLPDIAAKPESKPQYKSIPDSEKTVVEGSPMTSTVYPLGYCQWKWPAGRFPNQCILYLDQLEELEKFIQGPDYAAYKAQLVAAGLRIKGQPRQEG